MLYMRIRALHTRKRTLSIMYIYKRALHIICIRKPIYPRMQTGRHCRHTHAIYEDI